MRTAPGQYAPTPTGAILYTETAVLAFRRRGRCTSYRELSLANTQAKRRDLIDRERKISKQRVAFVTIGQSPRDDIVPEILNALDVDIEPIEVGLLDDLSDKQLDAAGAKNGEPALLTKLRDGTEFVLSMEWVRREIEDLYGDLSERDTDLVVLLSTMFGAPFQPAGATVFCDLTVDRAIEEFVKAGQNVGVILSLDGQVDHLRLSPQAKAKTKTVVARPGNDDDFTVALQAIADSEIIVLHSMAYAEEDRLRIKQLAGRPVVSAQHLVASAIQSGLHRLLERDSSNETLPPLSERLRSLSNREREVMFLVAEGLPNKVIARNLGISFRTVEIHRSRMLEKMAFNSLSELVREVDTLSRF